MIPLNFVNTERKNVSYVVTFLQDGNIVYRVTVILEPPKK